MKKITILDIAKELNITFSTVARALNDHPGISKTTKEAVRQTANRLGYQKNRIASSLRSGKSNVVGVLVPTLDINFFSSVVHGIETVMNDQGYAVLLYQSKESEQFEKKGINTFLRSRVEGIIASVSLNTASTDTFQAIKDDHVPLLFFDRVLPGLDVPSVTINDYSGGYQATEHLIKTGYRRIVHITETRPVGIFIERLRGYLDALRAHDIPVDENLIIRGNFSIEFGRHCVKYLMERQIMFDAVFTLEDFTAMGVMQQLRAAGKNVPQDVGVVGFANESFGSLVSPTLSTVDQQTIKMGEEVAQLFFRLMKEDDFYHAPIAQIQLDPLLLVRESSNRQV